MKPRAKAVPRRARQKPDTRRGGKKDPNLFAGSRAGEAAPEPPSEESKEPPIIEKIP